MTSKGYQYSDDGVSFCACDLATQRNIYFPLSGIDAKSLKSSITPYLSGDIKIDKYHYVTKPVSREDLRNPVRNFFVHIPGKQTISLAQDCDEKNSINVEAGLLWHKVTRLFPSVGLQIEALNFIPVTGENVELMSVTVKNISKKNISYVPTAAIPLFARSLANKHDHEHVTALLNRIKQIPQGVVVTPTMIFNEEGHQIAQSQYFVLGITDKGENPVGTFPTMDSFCGDDTNLSYPQAVIKNISPKVLSKTELNGKEAVGALRFKAETIKSKQVKKYFFVIGVVEKEANVKKIFNAFNSCEKFSKTLEKNKLYWQEKIGSVSFVTKDKSYDAWMRWVALQPILRRIFGCSFLPDHDYGKGGKGWRDLWQDLLSLILIEPENVREHLINNFGGVRIDGSHATIIGAKPGEFIADRNAISRVWMDHGVWPFTTLLLYIDQTGDYDILLEQNTYFRDPQLSRAQEKDFAFSSSYGSKLKDKYGQVYYGSIIEHMLIEHLVPFFNVGEHNIIRLEGADWNDGLDMAAARGESVTFMSYYAGNLFLFADLLEDLSKEKNIARLSLLKEIQPLLDDKINNDNPQDKKKLLYEKYFPSVQPEVSGEKVDIAVVALVKNLRKKAAWIFSHIRQSQKVNVDKNIWFNGYYDNDGKAVEGKINGKVRMTLTGQVFPIMSGLAENADIKDIVQSVKKYLVDKKLGGVRLNTDFGVDHYLSLGRAFGFAYGAKENGAFFSHMTVMYAFALYKRGFAREGYEVLNSLYKMCADTEKSKIYPGIPEYFDNEGRGMYPYLTGSASWFLLTQLTQVFGVRGRRGDLILSPKLVKEQFDKNGVVQATCFFAHKKLIIEYINKQFYDAHDYVVVKIYINNKHISHINHYSKEVCIPRSLIKNQKGVVHIKAIFDKKA
ncbi:MAG TPA: cellobiose phosphorylase [Candidatus Omnitrophota bacterium]|nr:cellobiose phosphorylase [Candidatus Omnitrophota bacterium]